MRTSLTFLILVTCLACQAESRPPAELVLGNVAVVDLETGTVTPDQNVFIEGSRIMAIEPSSSSVAPTGAEVVDARGQFLIPGLWDMHVHSATSASWHFPALLAHGVTGVRNLHTSVDDALRLADSIRTGVGTGRILGPRFVANGPIIDGDPSPWPGAVIVRSEDEARAAVDSLASGGAEFIKVYDNLSPGLFTAIMERADHHAIPVDGHLPFSVPATEAAGAGMRIVEHLSGITMGCSAAAREVAAGFSDLMAGPPLPFPQSLIAYFELVRRASDAQDERLCEQTIRTYVDNGTTVSPTLMVGWSQNNAPEVVADSTAMIFVPASIRQQWTAMSVDGPARRLASIMSPVYAASLARLRALHSAGVPIVAGTDLGNPYVVPGRSLHDELRAYVGLGLTPLEALRTATVNPATVLGMSDSLGVVAEGYVADLVLLDEDPTAGIDHIRTVKGIVRSGRYFSSERLRSLVDDALAEASLRGR